MSASRPAPFRPHGTIMLLYFAALFFLFAMLLVSPALLEVWRDLPPGPEQQAAATQAAQEAIRGRLPWAFGIALVTAGLGAWFQVLPGTRKG